MVIQIAQETGWGFTRIVGELRKLCVKISSGTVRSILKEEGLCPTPKPGEKNWNQFVKMHAESLWACDFFVKKVWSGLKLKTCYALFFIHIGTRKVHLAGVTAHPDHAWMAKQAEKFREVVVQQKAPERVTLFRDRDSKFTREFDAILKAGDLNVAKLTPQSPNLNPFAEVWIRSIKRECLDDFICFGEKHLTHVVEQYVEFYNTVRPHQGIGNTTIGIDSSKPPALPSASLQITCNTRLGGLLRDHVRKAA